MHAPLQDRVLKSIAATVTLVVIGLIILLTFTTGGQAAEIQDWTDLTDTPYPFDVASAEAVFHDGRIYVFGGKNPLENNEASNKVYAATVAADGTLGTWQEMRNLDKAVYLHAVVATDTHVYVIGGISRKDEGTVNEYSQVWYAAWEDDGTLGAWDTTTEYPNSIQLHEAEIVNGRIYVMGGFSEGAEQSAVRSAAILPTGQLSGWVDETDLKNSLRRFSAVATRDWIYVIGGATLVDKNDEEPTPQTVIWRTRVQSNGRLGTWTEAGALPLPSEYHESVIHDGKLLVIGGRNGDQVYSSVYSYVFNADGSLGAKVDEESLPSRRFRHAAVTLERTDGSFTYVIAGYRNDDSDDQLTNTVFRSAPPALAPATPTPTPRPGVRLEMNNDPQRWLAPGEEVTYIIEYENPGDQPVQNVTINDTLPDEVELVEGSVSNAGVNAPSINDELGVITWNVGDLEPGESGQVSYRAARVSPPVNPVLPLTIGKRGPARAEPGELVTYTLTVTNSLTGVPFSNVVITDTVPANGAYVSGGQLENGIVRWTIPVLPDRSSATVQFTVNANGTLVNHAYGAVANDGQWKAPGTQVVVTQVGDTDPGAGDGTVIPNNSQAVWAFEEADKRSFSNWVYNPDASGNFDLFLPLIQR